MILFSIATLIWKFEYFLEKYQILSLDTKAQSREIRLNSTHGSVPTKGSQMILNLNMRRIAQIVSYIYWQQECIPVECVTSAAVAVGEGGVCLSACWDTPPVNRMTDRQV